MKIKSILLGVFILFSAILYSQEINKDSLNMYFDNLSVNNKFMGNVSISSNKKVIYNKAVGFSDIEKNMQADQHTLYKIGSISKMFTAVLILKAIEEKKLSLDTKLSVFFPMIKNSDKITIQNLLNHSSGIYSITDDEDYLTWNDKKMSQADFLNRVHANENLFEPSAKNEYSNSNYILLSYILEKIYKKSYSAILQNQIAKPLHLNNTFIGDKKNAITAQSYSFKTNWNKEASTHYSVPLGAGAIVSTADDLLTFINSIFDYKILNKQSVDLMTTFSNKYGFGIFDLSTKNEVVYGHDGAIDGFKSIVKLFPDQKMAYVILSNGINYNLGLISRATDSAIYKEEITIPQFKTIQFTNDELNNFVGVFAAEGLPFKIEILNDNLILTAQASGQAAFALDATDKNVFTFDKAGIKLTFKNNGKTMILNQAGREIELTKE